MSEQVVKLRIEGMNCGACVGRVEQALQSVDGVTRAWVNLTTATASVEIPEQSDLAPALIEAVRAAGFDAQRARSAGRDLTDIEANQAADLQQQRQAMVQAIGLALPVIALEWAGTVLQSSHPGGHVWWRVLQGLLCTMLMLSHAGGPILVGGVRALLHKSPNMDLLITLGVLAAYVSSAVSLVVAGAGMFHFHAAAMILGFINVGKYFESRAKREASSAVATLARRIPKTAIRVRDGQSETIPIEQVSVGDHLRVADDTVVPVDGTVIDGTAAVDQSMMTGESMPVSRRVGDPVFGGSLVCDGTFTIKATAIGEASAIGAIVRAVEDAQAGKTKMQRIADRVSGVFVPVVVVLALLTLAGWTGFGFGFGDGLRAAIAVLVVACPCAMGLATPTAVLVATSAAALRGILVRDAASLEAAGRIDTVMFDKTGTLTTGQARVESLVTLPSNTEPLDPSELWTLAGSAEQLSQHPLARAIVAEARRQGVTPTNPTDFKSEPGLGVSATVNGRAVLVGGVTYLQGRGVVVSNDEQPEHTQSAVWIAVDGVAAGVIGLSDTVRDSAASAVAELRGLGVHAQMVTGDGTQTAMAVAASIGIEQVDAEVSPGGKADLLRPRQQAGSVVAFVGDGINDAPALTAADVGIAFAAGTDVARAAADITLMGDDLALVPAAIRMARRSVRVIKQNLFWAFFYNVLAIPLAATGNISPAVAAAAMMVSSITVVLNSVRLRKAPDD